MEHLISRVRARKTRTRQRRAEKAAGRKTAVRGNPWIGLSVAGVLWLFAVALLGLDGFLAKRTDPGFLLPLAGNGAFLLISLFAAGLFLEIVKPGVIRDNRKIALMGLISILSLAPAKAILFALSSTDLLPLQTVQFLLPLAMAPLLATILVDGPIGMAVGVWTSLTMALLAGGSLPVFIAGMVATVVTASTAYRVRTRSKVVRTGLVIGLSETVCVFGLTALQWNSPDIAVSVLLHQAAACLVSGFVSALLALLILPMFESVFDITSDISLLELSDLGHPLLQRLAIEAPGTYHHSLVVANLAQAAANEIGANGLLVRVGAYFHDVGKLTKPDFFTENIQHSENPHDTLPPSMSTLVITSHVKEGLSLAMLYKLPNVVRQAICEHHGTGVLSYFHHKAQVQIQDDADASGSGQANVKAGLDDTAFRYPGPRPCSPETAILCLADSVEAASRSMAKTTPGHLKDLVNDIVNARLIDGQLDNSGLTLSQLNVVKRSFVFTLTSMLHGRVPYPKNENTGKQQARQASPERAGAKEADPMVDGQDSAPSREP